MNRRIVRGVAAAIASSFSAMPSSAGPTDGWARYSTSYEIHKPYDVSVGDRFRYRGGVWTFWVFDSDKAHRPDSRTAPRSEVRWHNDYTSGRRMWDGDVYLVAGTNGASIAQVFGASQRATASMVFAYSAARGSLRRYDSDLEVLATGINNKWTNLKLAHDADANIVRIYVNDSLKSTEPDHGDNVHYFKNGVYGQKGASKRMECRFRNVKLWHKK